MGPQPAMQLLSHLPSPPDFGVEVVRDRDPGEPGFLRYVSRWVRTVGPQGERSSALVYDEVDRPALDAVVIVAHFAAEWSGEMRRFVVLRSAIRPPLALRDRARSLRPEPENPGLWEIPAGLVEPDETGETGLRAAAQRELYEETGFNTAVSEIRDLGPSILPAPGIIAERQFLFHVEVDPKSVTEPPLDGSPLEQAGEVIAVPLDVALQAAREGRLADAKTELALRRLSEELSP